LATSVEVTFRKQTLIIEQRAGGEAVFTRFLHEVDLACAARNKVTGLITMPGGTLLLALASARLAHASQRNTVIARNIAHADTPGFKAQDLAEFDFARMAASESAQPKATRPGHAVAPLPQGRVDVETREVPATDESPDGNTVTLEEQMVKAAETRGQFELAATLYSKHLSLLRTAIGRDNR
jgi:flagellar basal-body rod protein FlgB